ncbi:Hypothetical predicted protein [Lecanosticta acicola]|uniref:Uncharacterized protein n=1 Tax=Lecanosticta acicola TaxID=111012 RepID=A0AAI8YVL6_9PEZI|nr:Hypothetical predicted protein [Lecanosticta acicola]
MRISTQPEKGPTSIRDETNTPKADMIHIEESPQSERVMRSTADVLTVWQAVNLYKLVTVVAMTAEFCASLDGYHTTLNGSIVSGKDFVRSLQNQSP